MFSFIKDFINKFFIDKYGEKLYSSYKKSVLFRLVRILRFWLLYLRHVWRLSTRRESLHQFVTAVYEEFGTFNLLNYAAKGLSALSRKLKWKKGEELFEYSMQESSGINRHVLTRYILKELFLYFSVAFLFFFMAFFVNQILLVAENILKKRVPVMDVIRLITYSLPMVIAQSAPFATLVGFLMCLGRLASENEILILRASGQGYRKLLKPVIFLGLMISIASFFVNDYLLPLGTLNYNKLYRSILTSNPAVELESNSIKRTNDKTLVIGNVKEDKVSDMIFFDTDSDGGQRIIIAGNSIVRKSTKPGILMNMLMDDASVIMFDRSKKNDYDVMICENMELNIFESTFLQNNKGVSPREMTSYDLAKQISKMKKDDTVTSKQMNSYRLEMAKKFSMPFGSIFFALLALPLALIFGKHNGQTIGFLIGLIISLVYWAMSIVGQIFSSRSGVYGVSTMWAPNILIGISGVFFYLRLMRK